MRWFFFCLLFSSLTGRTCRGPVLAPVWPLWMLFNASACGCCCVQDSFVGTGMQHLCCEIHSLVVTRFPSNQFKWQAEETALAGLASQRNKQETWQTPRLKTFEWLRGLSLIMEHRKKSYKVQLAELVRSVVTNLIVD